MIAEKLWHYRKYFFGFLFVLLLVFAPFAAKVTPDNSIENMSLMDDQMLKDIESMDETFGVSDVMSVTFADANIFSKENLELVEEISVFLEGLSKDIKVASLTRLWQFIPNDQGDIKVGNLVDLKDPNFDAANLKNIFLNSPPIYKNLIFNTEASATAILATSQKEIQDDAILKKIRNFLSGLEKKQVRIFIFRVIM